MAPSRIRRAILSVAAALLLAPLLCAPLPAGGAEPSGTGAAPTYEERASAEKTSRSRYRKLEVASAILIVGCGAAVIYWAVRRK